MQTRTKAYNRELRKLQNEAIAILLAVAEAAAKSLVDRQRYINYASEEEIPDDEIRLFIFDKIDRDLLELEKFLPSFSSLKNSLYEKGHIIDGGNVVGEEKYIRCRVGNAYAYSSCYRWEWDEYGYFMPLAICCDRSELRKVRGWEIKNYTTVFAAKHFERLETIEAATKFLNPYAKLAGIPDAEFNEFMLVLELASIIPNEKNKHKVKKYPF